MFRFKTTYLRPLLFVAFVLAVPFTVRLAGNHYQMWVHDTLVGRLKPKVTAGSPVEMRRALEKLATYQDDLELQKYFLQAAGSTNQLLAFSTRQHLEDRIQDWKDQILNPPKTKGKGGKFGVSPEEKKIRQAVTTFTQQLLGEVALYGPSGKRWAEQIAMRIDAIPFEIILQKDLNKLDPLLALTLQLREKTGEVHPASYQRPKSTVYQQSLVAWLPKEEVLKRLYNKKVQSKLEAEVGALFDTKVAERVAKLRSSQGEAAAGPLGATLASQEEKSKNSQPIVANVNNPTQYDLFLEAEFKTEPAYQGKLNWRNPARALRVNPPSSHSHVVSQEMPLEGSKPYHYVSQSPSVLKSDVLKKSKEQQAFEKKLSVRQLLFARMGLDPVTNLYAEELLAERGFTRFPTRLVEPFMATDYRQRRRLAEIIGQTAAINPLPWLLELAKDPEPSVRHRAMTVMLSSNNSTWRDLVYELAINDSDSQIAALAKEVRLMREAEQKRRNQAVKYRNLSRPRRR